MIINKKTPVLGRFSGTVDNWIVYLHRGRQCIRKKPSKVKPPSAPGQVAQQERMASIAIFYQSLKEVGIYPWWRRAAEGMVENGYNLLVKNNLPAFGGEGRICNFSKLCLTTGPVALPDGMRVETAEEGQWKVVWEETPLQVNASPEDRVMLYAMKDWETFVVKPLPCGDARRRDGEATFLLPEGYKDYVHLYVVFCSHTGEECSKSSYFHLTFKNKYHGKIQRNSY